MANVRELIQKLRFENIAGNRHGGVFLRTIADGNCGPRAALQSLLITGFLRNTRQESWDIFYNICTGHGHKLPASIEFDTLKEKYLTSTSLDKFANEFMTLYCSPAGDPELRHDGDALVTNCSVLLRDQIQFDSETVFNLVNDDPDQFKIGETLNMEYALPYFKKLGVDLVIKYRNDPNRILKYEGDLAGEGFKIFILYDNTPGAEHFDVFIPTEDLQAYCNMRHEETIQPPVRPMLFSEVLEKHRQESPEQILATADQQIITAMMHDLNALFVSKKHQEVTVAEVQDIVTTALNDPFATHDAPIRNLVAVVNEQNRMASILGCSNSFVDLICDFILKLFKADRLSVINKACDTFKESIEQPREQTETDSNRMAPNLT